MPERPPAAGVDPPVPDDTERLARAIDRLMIGGPAPVLDDPELQELLALAMRLRDELPRDLPDPAFRDDLRSSLLRARVEPLPAARARTAQRPPRVSYLAALSAIAAVLVAAVAVGALALQLNDDDDATPGNVVRVLSTNTPPLTGSAIATMTVFSGTSDAQVAVATQRPDETAAAGTGSAESGAPTATAASDDAPTPSAAIAQGSPAATATADRALAGLPPVDATTVETGENGADGGGEPPASDLQVVLDTTLPQLEPAAAVYHLAPSADDPTTLVTTVAAALGIEGDAVSDASGDELEVHVESADQRRFQLADESGWFSYLGNDAPATGAVTGDDAAFAVRDWLASIGYPVELLAPEATAEPFGEGQWLVELRYAGVPEPGIGRPLGVRAFVNEQGVVLSADGYWLVPSTGEEVALVDAQQAWDDVVAGRGYWTGGGIASGGGELRVDALAIAWVLTHDGDGLVLQPVVRADGTFRASDGGEARISVFVQAARASD